MDKMGKGVLLLFLFLLAIGLTVIGVLLMERADRDKEVKELKPVATIPMPREDVKVIPNPVKPTPPPVDTRRAGFKREWMGGCMIKPDMGAYCACTFDFLYDKHGPTGLMDIALDYSSDYPSQKFTDYMMEAIGVCIKHLKD